MTLEQALETYIRFTHGEIGLQKFWAERNAQMAVVMGSRKEMISYIAVWPKEERGWDIVRD